MQLSNSLRSDFLAFLRVCNISIDYYEVLEVLATTTREMSLGEPSLIYILDSPFFGNVGIAVCPQRNSFDFFRQSHFQFWMRMLAYISLNGRVGTCSCRPPLSFT